MNSAFIVKVRSQKTDRLTVLETKVCYVIFNCIPVEHEIPQTTCIFVFTFYFRILILEIKFMKLAMDQPLTFMLYSLFTQQTLDTLMNGAELVFLYQIKEGSASSSHACYIAAQVGLSQHIVKRGVMVGSEPKLLKSSIQLISFELNTLNFLYIKKYGTFTGKEKYYIEAIFFFKFTFQFYVEKMLFIWLVIYSSTVRQQESQG